MSSSRTQLCNPWDLKPPSLGTVVFCINGLTLCILMGFSIQINRIRMGPSIIYFKG